MVAPLPLPDPSRTRRLPEGLRLALAAGVAAALVLTVLVLTAQRADGTSDVETASGGLRSSSSGPGDPLSGESTPVPSIPEGDADEEAGGGPIGGCPEGTIIEVCDAVAFIEDFKGDRPFKTFPTVNFIDGDAFDEFVLEDFADAEDGLRDSGDVMRSLGMIEADVDLADAMRTTLELGVVGAYNTETEELNINGTEVNLYTQMVMVHELTHAWDDQYFELARPEYDDADGELASGFLNVTEGSATLTADAWRATLDADQQAELEALQLSVIPPDDMDLLFAVPVFVLQLQISPYTDGAAFVQAIFDEQAIAGVDALFDAPPTTTEQVLHLEAYRSGEGAVPVASPEAVPPTAEFDRGVLGELTFNLWLGPDIGSGWGGDEYVSWRTADDTTCTTLRVVGDTESDTDEFRSALDAWASQATDGATRTVELVDGTITATGCL